jgi:LacI family transcriptional regulator
VRPDTQARVAQAVKLLNYRPNFAARALAGSRSYLIGLYYDNPSPDYVAALQVGAMRACRESGHHLLLEQIDSESPRAASDVARRLHTVRVDGVILSPPVCDRAEVLDLLDREGVAYVRLAPAGDVARSPFVHMDDRQAAFEMTRHLQQLGHRRIGFIGGPVRHSATALRRRGFLDAMAAAGLPVERELVQPGAFSFRSGVGCAERLLSLPRPPTAIFASNDDMALGVMAVANRMRLAVPQALSVAGFDDSPIAQVVWPQLTSIRQPVAQMAAEATRMLVRPDGAAGGRLLDFQLIIRGSTGPAA